LVVAKGASANTEKLAINKNIIRSPINSLVLILIPLNSFYSKVVTLFFKDLYTAVYRLRIRLKVVTKKRKKIKGYLLPI